MLKSYKYLLEPTIEQSIVFEEWDNILRFVFNCGLEQRQEWLKRGKWINYMSKKDSGIECQSNQFTEAKKSSLLDFLNIVPSDVLQQCLMDLDRACKTNKNPFKVHFKSKKHSSMGFRFPNGKNFRIVKLNKNHSKINIPKIGWLSFRNTREFKGSIRSCTIKKNNDKYFLSILVETNIEPKIKHDNPNTIVGIDRGVKVAVVTSDNVFYEKKAYKLKEIQRYKLLQKKLSRQKRNSSNRLKTIKRINDIKSCEVNRRKSFLNKTVNTLANQYETIILEDLKTRNMTKTAKGTEDKPGKNVKQKSGLNREILAKGWFMFQTKLQQKAKETGSNTIFVNPKNTSRTCSMCGFVAKENRESQTVFKCKQCGLLINADYNAALNIKTRGQKALIECGGGLPLEDQTMLNVWQEESVGNRKELLLTSNS